MFDRIFFYIKAYYKKINFKSIKSFMSDWFEVAKMNFKSLPKNFISFFNSVKTAIIIGFFVSFDALNFIFKTVTKFAVSVFSLILQRLINIKIKRLGVKWFAIVTIFLVLDLSMLYFFEWSPLFYFSLAVFLVKKKILFYYAYVKVYLLSEKIKLVYIFFLKLYYKVYFLLRLVYTIVINFFLGSTLFHQTEDRVLAISLANLLFFSYFFLIQKLSNKFILKTNSNIKKTNKNWFKLTNLITYIFKIFQNFSVLTQYILLKLKKISLFFKNISFSKWVFLKSLLNTYIGFIKLKWRPIFKKTSYFGLLRSYISKWLKK